MRIIRGIIIAFLVTGCSPIAVHSAGEALTDDPQTSGFTAAPILTVSNPTPAPSQVVTFSASGGVPPYNFFLASGDGTLDSVNLNFTTPSTAEIVMLGVTDSAGFSGYANLNVVVPSGSSGTSGGTTAFTATPASTTIAPNSSLTFVASGGTPPYSLELISGTGTISGLTFQASPTQGPVSLSVMDSAGHSQAASIMVQTSYSTTQGIVSFNITVDQFLGISFDNNTGAANPYFGFVGMGPAANAASEGQYTPVTLGNYNNLVPAGVSYRGTIKAIGRNASVSIEYCIPPVHKGYAFVRIVSGVYSFETLAFNATTFEGSQATTALLNLDTASGSGTVSVELTGGYSDSVDCSDYAGNQYVDVGQ